MSKLIIMQGLPASGKTTRAAELMKEHGNAVRINRDLLRKMLHFSKWTGLSEGHTVDAAKNLAAMFLSEGMTVIIDDTNLREGTVQSWVNLAKEHNAKIQYERMDVSMADCILRDSLRDENEQVGKDVIVQMALSSGLCPRPEKGFVLCDIDGTLADISHRLHFVYPPEGEKKDWDSFFAHMMSDTPRIEIIDMLLKYEDEGHEIIFVSARPEKYRAFTEDWIVNKAFKGYEIAQTLIMRRTGDHRPDTEVKQSILNTYFKDPGYPIHCVIDDRPSVIRMWRENGIEVYDAGSGVEF